MSRRSAPVEQLALDFTAVPAQEPRKDEYSLWGSGRWGLFVKEACLCCRTLYRFKTRREARLAQKFKQQCCRGRVAIVSAVADFGGLS